MKEYGGYLPLDLRQGLEWFSPYESMLKRYNTGRSAIYDVLCQMKPKRVLLPRYICESIVILCTQMGVDILQYGIHDDFTINDLDFEVQKNDLMLLVNYFGLQNHYMQSEYDKFENVIIDNTQAFFATPIIENSVWNVYSCRKFIGVSDGGYLVAKELPPYEYEESESSAASGFLLKSIEHGTNFSYEEYKTYENQLNDGCFEMSTLTKHILKNVDYEFIKMKRSSNFNQLHTLLKESNLLTTTTLLSHEENISTACPYLYPFLPDSSIREALIDNKIYVPQLWKHLDTDDKSYESTLAKNLICLPIDQRYDIKDMQYLANVALSLLG